MSLRQVHRGTSWGSVLGGWFAAVGAFALLFPLSLVVLGVTPAAQARVDDPLIALPVVAALFVSYLVGGYVAGRMAGYRRSWHGLMSAVWGLLVALVLALVAGVGGYTPSSLGALVPIDVATFGNAVTFGAILGFSAAILGGWIGGLLSPGRVPVGLEAPRVVERGEVMEQRPRRGLLARWFGRRRRVERREAEVEREHRRSA